MKRRQTILLLIVTFLCSSASATDPLGYKSEETPSPTSAVSVAPTPAFVQNATESPSQTPSNSTIIPESNTTTAPTKSPAPTTATKAPTTLSPSASPQNGTLAPTATPNNSTTSAPTTSAPGNATTAIPTTTPSNNVTVAPTTVEPANTTTTAPTTKPTISPTVAPAANKPKHRSSFWKIIGRTIAWLIFIVLGMLGFAVTMNNRYRIYYFLRYCWYMFLSLQCTRTVRAKIREWTGGRVFGGDVVDDSNLNTVIFEDQGNEMSYGLLMNENEEGVN